MHSEPSLLAVLQAVSDTNKINSPWDRLYNFDAAFAWPQDCDRLPAASRRPGAIDQGKLNPLTAHTAESHSARITARPSEPLLDPKIGRGFSAAIPLNLVLDGLSLVERTQASLLNSRDVDKHIFATAACRLNKPISLSRIEPLHGTCRHFRLQMLTTRGRCRITQRNLHGMPRSIMARVCAMELFKARQPDNRSMSRKMASLPERSFPPPWSTN